MRLAGEMKRERDEAREKEEILLELHEGRMREAERRREALELELEIRKRLAFREAIQYTFISCHNLAQSLSQVLFEVLIGKYVVHRSTPLFIRLNGEIFWEIIQK